MRFKDVQGFLASLVLETVYRSRHSSRAVYEPVAAEGVDWHDGCISQQSSKLYGVAYGLAYDGYDTNGCSLLIHHSYGALVGYDASNGRCLRIAGDGNHVETNGADVRKVHLFHNFYYLLLYQ